VRADLPVLGKTACQMELINRRRLVLLQPKPLANSPARRDLRRLVRMIPSSMR
jgi:hypothetical protein